MFQSNKIHNNVLHLNFAPNYNSDVENNNDIENTNHSFQFWGNSTLDLKIEHLLAYNNNYVSESFNISAWDLYGSSRLGARNIDKVADVVFLASRNYNWINNTVTNEYIAPTASFTYKKYRLLGAKTFELTNHLGNVITTISDRKLMVEDAQNLGFVHHYKPEILSIGEQYAFGMSMPGRTYSVEKYRYGMNTQEKDDEIFEGAFTAEFWEYDSRVGRRWNNDPVVYEWQSPYACFNNNPIYFADPRGLQGEKGGGGTRDFAGQAPGSGDKDYKPNSNVEGKGSTYGLNNLPTEQYVYKRTFKDKLRSFFKYKAKEIFNRLAKGITKVLKNMGKAIVNGLRKIDELLPGKNGYTMTSEEAQGSNNGSPGLPSKEMDASGFLAVPIPSALKIPGDIGRVPFPTLGENITQDAKIFEAIVEDAQKPVPVFQQSDKDQINNEVYKSQTVLKYEKVGIQYINSKGEINGTVIPLNPNNKKLIKESKNGIIDISKVDFNEDK
jgi:hypothetical protein